MYDSILKEAHQAMESDPHVPLSSIALELVSPTCREDVLLQVLHNISSVRCSEKSYDAATEARCKEAILAREEADDLAVFQIAVLVQNDKSNTKHVLDILSKENKHEILNLQLHKSS